MDIDPLIILGYAISLIVLVIGFFYAVYKDRSEKGAKTL